MNIKAFWLLAISFLLISPSLFAIKNTSVKDGNWSDATVWSLGRTPIATDSVYIVGHEVAITSGTHYAGYLYLGNSTGRASITMTNTGALTVQTNFDLNAQDVNYSTNLYLYLNASLLVNGNMTATRNNSYNRALLIYLEGTSGLTTIGNFTYNYLNGPATETFEEIELVDDATIFVFGSAAYSMSAGGDFNITIWDTGKLTHFGAVTATMTGGNAAYFKVRDAGRISVAGQAHFYNSGLISDFLITSGFVNGGQLIFLNKVILESGLAGKGIQMAVANSGTLDADGNIELKAKDEGDVLIQLSGSSIMNLAGNIERPNNYGSLTMATGTKMILDGGLTQIIPEQNMTGSGADLIQFSNLELDLLVTNSISLSGDLIIEGDLELKKGVIKSTATSKLIIADGGLINGGNSDAYIEGPVEKRGTNTGSKFLFPLGHNGVYAPLAISTLTNSSSAYVAEYFSCPPPYGTSLTGGLNHISGGEFWTLDVVAGTEQPQVTLYWQDGPDQGILDTASLVVTGYVDGTGWVSFGRENLSVSNANYDEGEISNVYSCPPPYGTSRYTFGSTSTLNALPVSLSTFQAEQVDQTVRIFWETASETDVDYFIVEESINGIHFTEVDRLDSKGTSETAAQYEVLDTELHNGKNCYRLISVDLNGMEDISPIVAVNIRLKGTTASVFPNPVENVLHMKDVDLPDGLASVSVFDQNGNLVYEGLADLMVTRFRLPASVTADWQTGFYTIRVQNGALSTCTKFLKK